MTYDAFNIIGLIRVYFYLFFVCFLRVYKDRDMAIIEQKSYLQIL